MTSFGFMKRIFIVLWLIAPIMAMAQSVVQIPTVFHVLWNEPEDNIPDSLIFQTLELVNKDFRRQNDDTTLTPERFLSVAADTEIEFVLASSDQNGNGTNGITRTITDSSFFYYLADNMKFDAFGGKDAWVPCAYLNVWIVPELGLGYAPLVDGMAKHPGGNSDVDGVAIWHQSFEGNSSGRWRVLTMLLAQYLDLYFVSSQTCSDVDSVADTPITSWESLGQEYSCEDTIVTCSNGVDGDMFMNFMADRFGICKNLFTLGQKQRMHETLTVYRPGLLDESLCGLSVQGRKPEIGKVYPNPTNGQLNFQSHEKGTLSVLDLSGRTVLTSVAVKGQNTIDVRSLPDGVYLLQLQTTNSVSSARFVKN